MSEWTLDDIEEQKTTRREFMRNRTEAVEVSYYDGSSVDDYTDLPTGSPTVVSLDANVQVLKDGDNLLQLGGQVQVGDFKAIIHIDDVTDALPDVETLRKATLTRSNGDAYIVDVLEVKGLGAPNRVELGLVRVG